MILATFAPGVATIKYRAPDIDTDDNVHVDAGDHANVDPFVDNVDIDADVDADVKVGLVIEAHVASVVFDAQDSVSF